MAYYDYEQEKRLALRRSVEDDATHARALRAAGTATGGSIGAAAGLKAGVAIGTLEIGRAHV